MVKFSITNFTHGTHSQEPKLNHFQQGTVSNSKSSFFEIQLERYESSCIQTDKHTGQKTSSTARKVSWIIKLWFICVTKKIKMEKVLPQQPHMLS